MVMKYNNIVGHVPLNISSTCSSFLRRGGRITCKVTSTRQYSADLPQGGLEIPSTLVFEEEAKEISEVKKNLSGDLVQLKMPPSQE